MVDSMSGVTSVRLSKRAASMRLVRLVTACIILGAIVGAVWIPRTVAVSDAITSLHAATIEPSQKDAGATPHEFVVLDLAPHGTITLQLAPQAAPKTVKNFKQLVDMGWYNGTTLYRLEVGFCLQGGGWPRKSSPLPPVPLEYYQPNVMYAVSMARTADPNSATTEFSIMLNDNSKWLGPGGSDKYGYAVFAHVVGEASKASIEQISRMPTTKTDGLALLAEPVRVQRAFITTSSSNL